jgi:transposase InsO family protein
LCARIKRPANERSEPIWASTARSPTTSWTAEGWLYAAAVLDLYSRRIIGWSMQDSMTSQLVADAPMMAV